MTRLASKLANAPRRVRLPLLLAGFGLLSLALAALLLGGRVALGPLDRAESPPAGREVAGPGTSAAPAGAPGDVHATTLSPAPAGDRGGAARLAASTGPAAWAETRNLSAAGAASAVFPSVALDSTGGVHVVWTEGYRVKYAASRAAGRVVDLGPGSSARAAIAADGGQVHLAWGNLDNGQVMYARFDASGAQTVAPRGIGAGNAPAVAARGQAVAVVWQRVEDGAPRVRFRASADAGASWGPEEGVSGPRDTGFGQTVAIDTTGTVHAAFASGSRKVFSSERGAKGWSRPESRGEGYWPHLAAGDAGRAYLVFQGSDQDIRFAGWSGSGWQPAVKVNQSPGQSFFPRLAWDGSDRGLHVAWQEGNGSGSFQVYYSHSADGGATWSPMVSATRHGSAKVVAPDLKAAGGGLHLVLQDTTGSSPGGGYRIWYECTLCAAP